HGADAAADRNADADTECEIVHRSADEDAHANPDRHAEGHSAELIAHAPRVRARAAAGKSAGGSGRVEVEHQALAGRPRLAGEREAGLGSAWFAQLGSIVV